MTQSKHNTIQPNGVCWDCGKEGADAAVLFKEATTEMWWECECGRAWLVLDDRDAENWARAKIRGNEAIERKSAELWSKVQDAEGEIERGRTGKETQ
jgi:hypothetical protein